jgi:hypothetical protein
MLIVGRGVLNEAHGIVPAEVNNDGHQGIPDCFDEDVGDDVSCEWVSKGYLEVGGVVLLFQR